MFSSGGKARKSLHGFDTHLLSNYNLFNNEGSA